jgi:NAD(P)-dependent dehydrogenase (short-subunit alcohol dehydrogenase family)
MTESSQHAYPQHKDYFEDLRTLYPAGEYGTPRDVAELALFLASDEAKFMNGSVIAVDGALSAVHNLPSCVAPSPKQG